MLQPWWNGSRIATREEADAEAGSAAFVPAEAATTIAISGHFATDCPTSSMRKSNSTAAPDHSQETRSHLGRRLSPLMQKIQNRILIVLCQKNYLGTKVREDLSAATVEPFLGSSISPNSNLRSQSSAYVQVSLRPPIPKNFQIRAAGSTYGNHFRVTTYGESHGRGVGCVIDGCPPRIPLSESDVQVDLDRRRPGQSKITTPRDETDTCKIFSGVFEGLTTGTPIHVFVPSTDQRGRDYSELSSGYRPSHADATYDMKYGIRSVQGGGRSSARETIGRVASGAVAKKILKDFAGTEILAYVSQVHKVVLPEDLIDNETVTLNQIESNIVRCPDPEYAEKMIAAIDAVRVRGDSVGGVVTCIVRNCPRGIGSPVFDKLETELAKAAMSLPATKGFQFGSGFAGTFLTGSEHNDEFYIDEHGRTRTRTNRSGGIQGGISNGEIINMRIAFKPTSTISMPYSLLNKSHLLSGS